MEKKQKVVLIVALIAGLLCAVWLNLSEPVQLAYKHAVTDESFQELKDYVVEITKNADTAKPDKSIQINTNFSDSFLVISADTEFYGIEASFPLSDLNVSFDNGTISFSQCKIDYENVKYTEYTSIPEIRYCVIATLATMCTISSSIYLLCYWMPKEYKRVHNPQEN